MNRAISGKRVVVVARITNQWYRKGAFSTLTLKFFPLVCRLATGGDSCLCVTLSDKLELLFCISITGEWLLVEQHSPNENPEAESPYQSRFLVFEKYESL